LAILEGGNRMIHTLLVQTQYHRVIDRRTDRQTDKWTRRPA